MAGLLVIGCTAAQPSRSALPSLPAEASWIAFAFDADGGWDFEGGDAEIYLVDDSSGSRVNVTNHPANDFSPEWSPDGSTIVFRTNRDGDHEIYAMNADGSDPRNLTRDPGEQRSPAWSPDGARIAYASAGDDGFDIWLMDADGGTRADCRARVSTSTRPSRPTDRGSRSRRTAPLARPRPWS